MELARLGDTSTTAYENLAGLFRENLVVMAPFEKTRDGIGLEDRPARSAKDGKPKNDNSSRENSGSLSGHAMAGLTALSKKQKAGRSTSSCDKALYNGCSKRARFCSICKCPGHKRTTCLDRGDEPKQPRKSGSCSVCGVAGHRKSTCIKPLQV
ncbi:hypothetical protein QYE76_022611 [Lolium multiflorum]|uniref:Uncharacterized protein n=1 Tax=Lolium multiflorum TaxID=4521 RepID=A0AAD8RBT8_LOLMU|nr:hypothetical protein QYE76_022611 [Lolium multiflorum]